MIRFIDRQYFSDNALNRFILFPKAQRQQANINIKFTYHDRVNRHEMSERPEQL